MIHAKSILILFLLISIRSNCQSYLTELKNEDDFRNLSGPPLANKYGNVTAVKVVYDIGNDSLYYINTNYYNNHYDFCEKYLDYVDGIGNFFKRNYSDGPGRKYLLANLNYFQSINKYVIDISPIDQMTNEQIIQIVDLIKESTFTGSKLYFLINNPRLQQMIERLNKSVSTIDPSYIYGNLTYQAISKYKNNGILKVIDNKEYDVSRLMPDDIVILKSIPDYLPAVAGVIVTEFQTPLSHISLLGMNRKIPICAYTKAFDNNLISKYIGEQVTLTVTADTFLIEADSSGLSENSKKNVNLEIDLSVDSLIGVDYLTRLSASYVGSKAANFGELYQISKNANFKTPELSFAIPFYYYNQHIIESGADKLIQNIINLKPNNKKSLENKLKKIKFRIENTSINPRLISAIEERITSDGNYTEFRFRSSTNAEDITGFSGAGLYASKTGILNDQKKSIEKAVKTVWASLWSFEAYSEREYFNIDQEKIAMGILVHRSFKNEKVNGVALTKNIYRKNSNGFLINAQPGEESVVRPRSGVICDQFLCFPAKSNKIYQDKIVIDIITYSSINNNELVMSETEIQNLANQLEIIKKHFVDPDTDAWTYLRIGFDVEFKLDGENRQLYIKQVRPYND